MNRHASLLCAVAVCALAAGCGGTSKRPVRNRRLPTPTPGQPVLTMLTGAPSVPVDHGEIKSAAALAKHVKEACATVKVDLRSEILIDAPVKFQRWRPEKWASPAAVSRKKLEGAPAHISVDCREGDKGKWVVTLSQDMDLSKFNSLNLFIRSDKPVKLAVGVWTAEPGEKHLLFESRTVMLKPGGWQELKLFLHNGFKSAATDWKHSARIGNPAKTRAISLLIYGAEPCKVEFCGVSAWTAGFW